jgi:hypothetical protein
MATYFIFGAVGQCPRSCQELPLRLPGYARVRGKALAARATRC